MSNDPSRYDSLVSAPVHDGWDIEEDAQVIRTIVTEERPRRIITRNNSPDLGFDRSLNPYRGCEHGCSYCFARPTHAYLGLSAGLDFETRLIARPQAAKALRSELAAPRYRVAPIAMGTNTDPYQPIEGRYRIVRDILKVLADHGHPVTITTKGTLVERDIDILTDLAADGLAHVGVSVTTLDARLSRALEPRAAAPARRLQMIERLSAAGIPVRAMIAPIIPALTDHELEAIVARVADAGAQAAAFIMLRLPQEVAPLFHNWLHRNVPDRAARVIGRVRDLHGGRDYDAAWGQRMTGQGPFATLAGQRFRLALRRAGVAENLPRLRCDLFRVPSPGGAQLSLFD